MRSSHSWINGLVFAIKRKVFPWRTLDVFSTFWRAKELDNWKNHAFFAIPGFSKSSFEHGYNNIPSSTYIFIWDDNATMFEGNVSNHSCRCFESPGSPGRWFYSVMSIETRGPGPDLLCSGRTLLLFCHLSQLDRFGRLGQVGQMGRLAVGVFRFGHYGRHGARQLRWFGWMTRRWRSCTGEPCWWLDMGLEGRLSISVNVCWIINVLLRFCVEIGHLMNLFKAEKENGQIFPPRQEETVNIF